MINKLPCFLFFLLAYISNANAQSVAFYPFNSILSVSTNPESRVWGDLRFQTNSYFSSLSTEIAHAVNLNKNPKGRYYLGGGLRINYLAPLQGDGKLLEAYFFNGGVRSAPFEKIPQIQIAFEVSPYVARNLESGLFRTRLGLAYNFSHK